MDLVSEQSKTNGLTSFVVWLKKMLAGYHLWKISFKLRAAGLGEREITFHRGWSASLLHEKLSETHLKLGDGGGYEFLRTDGESTTRLVLTPGSKTEGYSVQYLKDNLNQATAYICPLQNDLSFTPLEGDCGQIAVSVS